MQELSCVDSYGLSLQLAFLYGPVGTSKRVQIRVVHHRCPGFCGSFQPHSIVLNPF